MTRIRQISELRILPPSNLKLSQHFACPVLLCLWMTGMMLIITTRSTHGCLLSAWQVVSLSHNLTRSVHRTVLWVLRTFVWVLCSAAIICSVVCFGSELFLVFFLNLFIFNWRTVAILVSAWIWTFLFLIFIYLFGCAWSQLWHVGSSSPTRDRTWAACIGSHWTTKKVPGFRIFNIYLMSEIVPWFPFLCHPYFFSIWF